MRSLFTQTRPLFTQKRLSFTPPRTGRALNAYFHSGANSSGQVGEAASFAAASNGEAGSFAYRHLLLTPPPRIAYHPSHVFTFIRPGGARSMWLSRSPDSDWEGLVASAGLLVILYAVQALIMSRVSDDRQARSLYALLAAATVPVCWGVSPWWHNPQCSPIATFLGWPVTIHIVPLWSFHNGLTLRQLGRLNGWRMKALRDLLIGVPVWYFIWGLTQLLVLGFMWI